MVNALTDAAKDAMLDSTAGTPAWPPAFLSLHSNYPGGTGANELAGGAPAYARLAPVWGAPAAGSRAITNAPQFDVPVGSTVAWVGMWSALAAGTYWGCSPAGAGARRAFDVNATDLTTDVLDSPAHGFANGDQVVVWAGLGAGLPAPLAEGTIYFVVGATTDTLQLSLTSGGAAINLTTIGDGDLQKIIPETFNAQGQYTVNSLSVSLPG